MLERKRLAVYAYEYIEHDQKLRRVGIVDIVGPTSIDAILKFLGYTPTNNTFGERFYAKYNEMDIYLRMF